MSVELSKKKVIVDEKTIKCEAMIEDIKAYEEARVDPERSRHHWTGETPPFPGASQSDQTRRTHAKTLPYRAGSSA